MTNTVRAPSGPREPFDDTGWQRPPEMDQRSVVEDIYLLSADGVLGRCRSGRFREDPELTRTLSSRIAVFLERYRSGHGDELAVALVAPNQSSRHPGDASMIFVDPALRDIAGAGGLAATSTRLPQQNNLRSVSQGMVEILGAKTPFQRQRPRFCPVLFVPEIGGEQLCRRCGLTEVNHHYVLEVLDLMAPFPEAEKRHPGLAGMVAEMLRALDVQNGDGLLGTTPAGKLEACRITAASNLDAATRDDPWVDPNKGRNTCFNDGDPVTCWLLAWFSPFNELDDIHRQFIARGHTISRRLAGTSLIRRGSREDFCVYLVEGTLEIEAFDGETMNIVGGTRRAHLPISQLRPHAHSVKAATDVMVILASQDMVREIARIATTYRARRGEVL